MIRRVPGALPVRRSLLLARLGATLVATALAISPLSVAQIAPLEDLAAFPQRQLEIRAARTRVSHIFDIWIADTPTRQAQGLMFVRDLPAARGMLFVNDAPRLLGMWMKNTYIELDMLFIGADGRIVHIAERTQPHSLDTIATPRPAQYVLELRGGEARRRTILPGDKVWLLANSKRAKLSFSEAPGGSQ